MLFTRVHSSPASYLGNSPRAAACGLPDVLCKTRSVLATHYAKGCNLLLTVSDAAAGAADGLAVTKEQVNARKKLKYHRR